VFVSFLSFLLFPRFSLLVLFLYTSILSLLTVIQTPVAAKVTKRWHCLATKFQGPALQDTNKAKWEHMPLLQAETMVLRGFCAIDSDTL
jgi:hypothetical protein